MAATLIIRGKYLTGMLLELISRYIFLFPLTSVQSVPGDSVPSQCCITGVVIGIFCHEATLLQAFRYGVRH